VSEYTEVFVLFLWLSKVAENFTISCQRGADMTGCGWVGCHIVDLNIYSETNSHILKPNTSVNHQTEQKDRYDVQGFGGSQICEAADRLRKHINQIATAHSLDHVGGRILSRQRGTGAGAYSGVVGMGAERGAEGGEA
jgi:hypothetical protein